MHPAGSPQQSTYQPSARSIGRIASVTGSKAIVLLDTPNENDPRSKTDRPEMGMLLAIDTANAIVLANVSALSVPVPAQGAENEIRIAELGLVGELTRNGEGKLCFSRGTTTYPALGDRVRLATKSELQLTYSGEGEETVRIGCIRQDTSIPAVVRIDDLLGKHFAVLGTTGTGKSCSTALILRAILEKNPNAHIVLLDPHNEYATAFGERAEVVSPRNMQLPLWLLNFEEAIEVLVGDSERKAEIEILHELIPVAKARYAAGRSAEPQRLRKGGYDPSRFTVDTPVPYRISDLTALIDERMGKLENRKDLAPYRQLKTRIETLTQDGRYAFMFGSVTVYDGMAQVLSRIFRVPVNGKPITIVELTGLPPEVVNVVVSVLCRMAFDFALWGEGQVPVTVVCEEAHRYVPLNPQMGFEPCKRAIAKIAKEGRKYGASLCIVTQRPAEIDPTILSQCNTVFALRMSNDRDQAIVSSAIADTGTGLLEFLPALGHREAIAFGDGVPLPVRIKFDELPADALPRSSTAKFSDKWQYSVGDEGFIDAVVERWRAAGICGGLDTAAQAHLLAEAMDIPTGGVRRGEAGTDAAIAADPSEGASEYGYHRTAPAREPDDASSRFPEMDLRRSPAPAYAPPRRTEPPQREVGQPTPSSPGGSVSRSALRERLLKPLR
jgi:DNA helicase HerA-like ATPase